MALERNPSTTKNAVLLLKGAGRGVISEHGAQMAIDLLENNGFQIWEMAPDPPVEPAPAPAPEPKYGSMKSIYKKMDLIRKCEQDVDTMRRSLASELEETMTDFGPVFRAIQMALEAKEVPQDGGEEG